ncbi:MAG: hypothetical protein BroJett025_08120 [Patescibacteria group bacterium]|nr:MAG: hypothetical protein BroJett025_08120 [Patescibacteria group bacterium]
MKRLKTILIIASFLIGLALLVGCASAPTSAPAAPATTTYVVTNEDARSVDTPAITAEVTWDGSSWTCNVQNCAQNKQINGNTMEFWVSMVKIATEDVDNPGQLIPEPGFTVSVK